MIFKDITNVTTAVQIMPNGIGRNKDLWVGITGTGSVNIEFLGDDGVWRFYPQSTFTAPIAQVVTMKSGKYRFKANGGPLTIEVGAP